jgi:hypothetical protein
MKPSALASRSSPLGINRGNQSASVFELMGEDSHAGGFLLPKLSAARILSKRRMMSRDSSHRKRHLGVDFTVWSSGESWFWLLINANGEGGIIGASASEAQAVRDAFISIEENWRCSKGTPKNSVTRIPLKASVGSAHATC